MPMRSSWSEPIQRVEQPLPQPTVSSRNLKATTGLRPKTAQQAIATEWNKGDRIDHKVFGKGTIQRVYRENDNDKIEIEFDTKGTKTLLLAYAKLERI
jgi:hypothetical protein